jgi:hypothetical protein
VQSRPSSVYEKRHLNQPSKNESFCRSNTNEPIYEPILPSIPPPLPKKPWEGNIKEEDAETKNNFILKEKSNDEQRGPTPLQRSPFIDNVALKALNEEQSLKLKKESLADDIADQLNQISLLTKQHMTEQGLVKHHEPESNKGNEMKSRTPTNEKVHTLKYNSGILNISDVQDRNMQIDTSSLSQSQPNNESYNDKSETRVIVKQEDPNLDKNAQALIANKNLIQVTPLNSQMKCDNAKNNDTYTTILKTENTDFVVESTSSSHDVKSHKSETKKDSRSALNVLSSCGDELPYIDESKGSDGQHNLNIVTGGPSACGAKQKRILSIVEEHKSVENLAVDEDDALNRAIIDAAEMEGIFWSPFTIALKL